MDIYSAENAVVKSTRLDVTARNKPDYIDGLGLSQHVFIQKSNRKMKFELKIGNKALSIAKDESPL